MLHKDFDRPVVARNSSLILCALFTFVWLVCASSSAFAEADDLVRTPVNPADRVALAGHHPSWADAQNDQGAVPADLALEDLTIVLARSPRREQAYTRFLQEQQDPHSPNYHHWLTPLEQGKRFGVSLHDIQAVTGWLESQHLQVVAVSPSRDRITFGGTALLVGNAFGAEMHYFAVSNEKRISITAEPQIPVALKDVIKSVTGLYTVKYYPQHKIVNVGPPQSRNAPPEQGIELSPEGTYSCNGTPCYFVFPADFATIYNVNTPGIDGTGETVAIIGRSRVYDADIQNFESASGLTVKTTPETVIIPTTGTDPGSPGTNGNATGDQAEATLDVTRSGSIAPGATIDLVVSASSQTEDGIGIATSYVVDTPVPAQIMSISFGLCEANAGQAEVNFWDSLFKTAAGNGVSVFVSSGDSAAAGCDKSFSAPPASQIASPNNICSSTYATCVGGTEFADFTNPSNYWNATSNPTNNGSAKSYIPEGAWNEPMDSSGNPQVAGTGGGVSSLIATPSYQVGVTGVPGTQGRYTPDIAFTSSLHDGYFACLAGNNQCSASGGFVYFAGTSAAAPDMAGITALLDQKAGGAQGLLNPKLYQLAGNSANGVFHDVTVASSGVTNCSVNTPSMCNNSTPSPTGQTPAGLAGYLVTAGFDEATGLGSINVANLLTNWSGTSLTPTTTTLAITPQATVTAGTSVTLTATITPAPPTGETVTFTDTTSDTVLGTAKTAAGGTAALTSTTIPGGSYTVVASYPGDTTLAASASTPAQALNVEDFTLSPSTLNITVSAPGQTGSGTITFGLLGGLTQAPSFSCSALPSESTCTFTAASATTETVTINTTAPSALLRDPLGRSTSIFYALLFPGLLGVVLPGQRRRRILKRLLGFMAVLAVLMLWIPACSSGGGTHNTGTPTGQTNVTVTATESGISHNITVNLNVQ